MKSDVDCRSPAPVTTVDRKSATRRASTLRATVAGRIVLGLLAVLVSMSCAAWQVHETTDEMSGDVSAYAFAEASETLNLGSFAPQVKVFLALSCDTDGGRYYVRTPGAGLGLDLYRAGSGTARSSYQDMRMRFDEGPVHETTWSVWDSSYASGSYEGATYSETAYTGRGPWWLTEQLRKGRRLRLELTFRGAGRHVVEFDLMGFNRVTSQCGEGAWAHALHEQHLETKERQRENETTWRKLALDEWKTSTAFRVMDLLAALESGDAEGTRSAAQSILITYKRNSETWLVMKGATECAPCAGHAKLKEWLKTLLEEQMPFACSTSWAVKYVAECREFAK